MERFRVKVNNKIYEVEVEALETEEVPKVSPTAGVHAGPTAEEAVQERAAADPPAEEAVQKRAAADPPAAPGAQPRSGQDAVTSPMPGKILKVCAAAGQEISSGTVVFIMEAMKMECDITAPKDGTIAAVKVEEGSAVQSGQILAVYQ